MTDLTELRAAAERLRQINHGAPDSLVYGQVIDVTGRNDPYVQDVRKCLGYYLTILDDPTLLLLPLVWKESHGGWWYAETIFGQFKVRHNHNGWWWWWWGGSDGDLESDRADSLEAAKQACQDNYRDRVRGMFQVKGKA